MEMPERGKPETSDLFMFPVFLIHLFPHSEIRNTKCGDAFG